MLRNGAIFQKRHIYETYEKAFQRVCGNLQCMNQSQFFVHFLHQPEHLQQKKENELNESKIPEKRPKKYIGVQSPSVMPSKLWKFRVEPKIIAE